MLGFLSLRVRRSFTLVNFYTLLSRLIHHVCLGPGKGYGVLLHVEAFLLLTLHSITYPPPGTMVALVNATLGVSWHVYRKAFV